MSGEGQRFDTAAFQFEETLRELRRLDVDSGVHSDAQRQWLTSVAEALHRLETTITAVQRSYTTDTEPVESKAALIEGADLDAVARRIEALLLDLRYSMSVTESFSSEQKRDLVSLRLLLTEVDSQVKSLRVSLVSGNKPVYVNAEGFRKEIEGELRSLHARAVEELHALEARLFSSGKTLSSPAYLELYLHRGAPLDPEEYLIWAEEQHNQDNEASDEGDTGGASIPAIPIRPNPLLPGAAARTIEEAQQPPRNP